MAPSEAMSKKFLRNNAGDKNIMALELLSILLGVSTFLPYLRGRCVQIWSDNTGAEGSLRKGVGSKVELNSAIHQFWVLAASEKFGVYVDRVPTEVNIADGPSRVDYGLLRNVLGAQWVEPLVLDAFLADPAVPSWQ